MSDPITIAVLAALEPHIRQIVDERIAAALAAAPAQRSEWATIPQASKMPDLAGEKRIRSLVKRGLVKTRSRNLDPLNCKQQKIEIYLPSLRAALDGTATTSEPSAPISASAWAQSRAARKAAP